MAEWSTRGKWVLAMAVVVVLGVAAVLLRVDDSALKQETLTGAAGVATAEDNALLETMGEAVVNVMMDLIGQPGRLGVGVGRQPQPQTVGQIGLQEFHVRRVVVRNQNTIRCHRFSFIRARGRFVVTP